MYWRVRKALQGTTFFLIIIKIYKILILQDGCLKFWVTLFKIVSQMPIYIIYFFKWIFSFGFEFFDLFLIGIIALQYCIGFLPYTPWTSHRYTYVPSLNLSYLPPHSRLPKQTTGLNWEAIFPEGQTWQEDKYR